MSTGVGTAQLCEWRSGSGCVAGSVDDCAAPPPPAPPPPPPSPPPKLGDLARSAIKGDISKLTVAEDLIEESVLPVVHESAELVAHATGLVDWQVEYFLPAGLGFLILGTCAALCYAPNRQLRDKRTEISRAVHQAIEHRSSGGKFARVSARGEEEEDSLRPVL